MNSKYDLASLDLSYTSESGSDSSLQEMPQNNSNDSNIDFDLSNDEDTNENLDVLIGRLMSEMTVKTNPYNMFVTQAESKLNDINLQKSKNDPSHNIIMTLL